MNYHLELMVKKLLGTDIAERNFAIFPDDTFLVSYPRSGNTWTRFLIANLVYPRVDVSFKNIERLIPDTSSQSSRALRRTPRPRIIKTHEYFDHRCRKIICIVRDPRDVALSYYDFQRKYRHIEDGYPLVKYVDDFVCGRLNSKDWGTWGENVASWLYTRGRSKDFLLLRYEDMTEDPAREPGRRFVCCGTHRAIVRGCAGALAVWPGAGLRRVAAMDRCDPRAPRSGSFLAPGGWVLARAATSRSA